MEEQLPMCKRFLILMVSNRRFQAAASRGIDRRNWMGLSGGGAGLIAKTSVGPTALQVNVESYGQNLS